MGRELRWHDTTERVQFRIAIRPTVYRCLRGMSPEYLAELCFPVEQTRDQGICSSGHHRVTRKLCYSKDNRAMRAI